MAGYRQPIFDLRGGSLHLRLPSSHDSAEADEEWRSTLQFLDVDDFFGGDESTESLNASALANQFRPVAAPSTAGLDFCFQSFSSSNGGSGIFNEGQINDMLGAFNSSNQSLEEVAPTKTSQTIAVMGVDYRGGDVRSMSCVNIEKLRSSKKVPSLDYSSTEKPSIPSSSSLLPSLATMKQQQNFCLPPRLEKKCSSMSRAISVDEGTAVPPRKKRKPRATSFEFPFRLHKMLNDIQDKKEHTECIQWIPNGCGFMVLSVKNFSTSTLPLYFGTLKYKSFIRQLNIYGFIRRHGAYIHPCFIRGHPDLCWNMRRQKIKGTGISSKNNKESLPGHEFVRGVAIRPST